MKVTIKMDEGHPINFGLEITKQELEKKARGVAGFFKELFADPETYSKFVDAVLQDDVEERRRKERTDPSRAGADVRAEGQVL